MAGTTWTSWSGLCAQLRRVDTAVVSALLLSLLLLGAFWAVPYLPMVDLPQHSAQIAVWVRLHDPSFPQASSFQLNLRTPYIGAYVLARVLATWLGVVSALKFVVWLSVVGHWAAFDRLVRKLNHPRWLGLFGLPLALGYGFYYGFISFLAALPFALLAMSAALDQRKGPTAKTAFWLAATLCATLATHGFALGMTVAVVAPLLLRGAGSIFVRFLPLLAPAVLGALWLMPGTSAHSIGATLWDPRLWDLAQIPALLLAASGADRAASVGGVVILSLLALGLGRPSRELERGLPLVLMLLGYCLFPISLGGFGPLHPRFAAFVVPCTLIACEPRNAAEVSKLPALIGAACVAWLALFAARLSAFARETQPIADFVARMPQGLSIRPLVFDRTGRAFPGLPAFLHLSAYYMPEKAGAQGYSFAMYPTSVIRYAPSVTPSMGGGAEWHPEDFSAKDELGKYDCFLVHSELDRSTELFGERLGQLDLAFHEQGFWAYLTRSARGAPSASSREGSEHAALVVSRSN